MHLKLVRSGGFAGLTLVASLDAGDLSPDQQRLVAALLTQESPRRREGQPGGADQFSYQLEIIEGDRTFRHRWREIEIPDTFRPLLAALVQLSKPEAKPEAKPAG